MSQVILSTEELTALVRSAVRAEISGLPAATTRPGPGWLRVSEAAAQLDVDRTTIARWVIDGTIPASARLQTGRTHRIASWWIGGHRHAV